MHRLPDARTNTRHGVAGEDASGNRPADTVGRYLEDVSGFGEPGRGGIALFERDEVGRGAPIKPDQVVVTESLEVELRAPAGVVPEVYLHQDLDPAATDIDGVGLFRRNEVHSAVLENGTSVTFEGDLVATAGFLRDDLVEAEAETEDAVADTLEIDDVVAVAQRDAGTGHVVHHDTTAAVVVINDANGTVLDLVDVVADATIEGDVEALLHEERIIAVAAVGDNIEEIVQLDDVRPAESEDRRVVVQGTLVAHHVGTVGAFDDLARVH